MSQTEPYTFQKQLDRQESYSCEFRSWLRSRNNVIGVTEADMSDERRGIDLWIVTLKSNPISAPRQSLLASQAPIPVQVKTDFIMHDTGNLAVELISKFTYDREHKPGWFHQLYSTKLLAYICAKTGDVCIYRSFDFWKAVAGKMNTLKAFSCLNGTPDGGEYWHSMGVLVPAARVTEAETMRANIYEKSPGMLIY